MSIAARHGIETIASTMAKHSNIPEVQQNGCAALRNLAQNNNANRVSIAANHGIEAIVSAMKAHNKISEVQEYGCGALGNLACSDANRVSLSTKHGIEVIVSAKLVGSFAHHSL
jgi:hypothetical protein